ncbi:hypothetical protein ACOSP7_031544 [Xanthoceras sorbifolium]
MRRQGATRNINSTGYGEDIAATKTPTMKTISTSSGCEGKAVRVERRGGVTGGAAAGKEEWKTMKRGDRVRQLERKSAATVLARCGGRRGRVEDDEGCGDRVRGSGLRRLATKTGGNSTDEGRARQNSRTGDRRGTGVRMIGET